MTLDKHFFDSVRSDVSDITHYDASKLRSLINLIEKEYNSLLSENKQLRSRPEGEGAEEELSDISILSDKVMEKARSDAEDIISTAKANRDELQQAMVESMRLYMETLRKQQQDNVDAINRAWQSFLSKLDTDDGDGAASGKSASPEMKELRSRVAAIAEELRQIDQK